MTAGVALELIHGRTSPAEQPEDWGSDGPIFIVDYVHQTYMGNLRIGLPAPVAEGELRVVEDLVYYGGAYFGDWSVVSPDALDVEQRSRIMAFELAKARLPMLGTCTCCRHYRDVIECRGVDCQQCEACAPG